MAPTVPIDFTGQKESRKCFLSQMMGKSRKYSKAGHLSGFVPDYRHAVETMAESEGFGSSGRVDAELTASEDSCAPKRKCISLNAAGDGYDCFGVPMQVLTLSRMSRSERKDLELRLKFELEQVRALQKRIATMNVAVISPSSDIRSCSDGKKRPAFDSTVPQGKKRGPPGRNGARSKKTTMSGPVVDLTMAVALGSTSNPMFMKQCEQLLGKLMNHQFGWVFNTPVDVVKLNIPDYYTVIKHPMDLGTVKGRLSSGGYSCPSAFASDVRLTFANALTYNPPGNDVHYMAETLTKLFEQRWKGIEKKLPAPSLTTTSVQSLPLRAKPAICVETEIAAPMPPAKKQKSTPIDVKPEAVKGVWTLEDKAKITEELDALLEDLPESIMGFLKEQSRMQGQTNTADDEIEIDLDAFSDDSLSALRKLLDDHVLEKQKRQEKAEPCEMEILNESGFSNSSMQPCKGNEPVDEDVDIVGGNDAPISNFPPVEIDKDAANRNSKCSSSSSSSSESGSSSSDSDSGSSSESESDEAKAPPASYGGGKEKLVTEANSDQKRSDIGDSEIGNHSINGVAPLELDGGCKPIPVEEGGHREGESAPSERQVSPDKLYRAALLRNRFADTILKAREKALDKGEKLDPEKLRIEREELEKRQKEEKARLQAEAKAAEEARKRAEAEAAAEAKRQRELERGAARQALQMMEKTVEINENSQFMEDLEMFKAVDDEHMPNFTEEISPEHFQDDLARLGSFKLQGSSNPLEQLGLFMKADDDIEEEEIEPPQTAPEPELEQEPEPEPEPEPKPEVEPECEPERKPEPELTNDVEEGEID